MIRSPTARCTSSELSAVAITSSRSASTWTTIGSSNLDPLSLNLLEEGSLAIEDPKAAGELAEAFERDTRNAKRIEVGAKEIPGFWGTVVREAFRQVGKAPGR